MSANQVITSKGVMTYSDSGWAYLQCCRETQKYYQYWLRKCGVFVDTPIWKSHISVVRGDGLPDLDYWGKHEGEEVDFFYRPRDLGFNGMYWWLDVESPQIEQIRIELGLEPDPKYDLHLTIGKEQHRRIGCCYGQQMVKG